jgi:hypothetical protein
VRYWTVNEARAYLPRLRQLLEVLVTASLTAARARGNGKGSVKTGERGRPALTPQSALTELQEGGVVLRDLASGIVDFPARGEDGVVYLLCWHRDDGDDLGWWHLPEDGFAGRKPLPREPGPPAVPDERA